MKALGTDVYGACAFYSAFVPDFAGLVDVALPQPPMAVLIAANSVPVPIEMVRDVAAAHRLHHLALFHELAEYGCLQ
jgi:hypothetical protein